VPACPWCAEEIKPGLAVCPYCGSQLTSAPAAPGPGAPEPADTGLAAWGRERLEKVHAWMTQPGRPRRTWPAKVRWPVWVCAGLGVAALASGVAASVSSGASGEGCLIGGIIFGSLFGLIALIALAIDLSQYGPDQRTSPILGAKAWLKALRWKRFDIAHACLIDQDHFEYGRPTIQELASRPGTFDFADARQFRDYWKGLVSGGDLQARSVESWAVDRAEKIDDDTALVDLRLTVTSYPSLLALLILVNLLICVIVILVLRKRYTFQLRKLVVRRGGQWWVVNGEADDNIDQALADAARGR
jgi:hypothetical protein